MLGRLHRLKARVHKPSEAVSVTNTTADTEREWVALKGDRVVATGDTSADLVRSVRSLGTSGRGAIVVHRTPSDRDGQPSVQPDQAVKSR